MQNREIALNVRTELLKKAAAVPSDIKVYRNKLINGYEVWLRGCFVMGFAKLGTIEVKKLNYRFSQHNSRKDIDKEIDDLAEYRKRESKQLTSDIINEMASDVDKYGNKNALSVSVLPKR